MEIQEYKRLTDLYIDTVYRVALNSSWHKKVTLTDEQKDVPVFTDSDKGELYELVMKMTPKYRQVIYLYYFEEFSISEVADILKISQTAVSTRLQRARNKLREQLGGMK